MISQQAIRNLFREFCNHTASFPPTLCDAMIAEFGHDPYIILISCLLSLRSRDVVTIHVCRNLFNIARTPQQMVALDQTILEAIIHKTGFYKNKANVLQTVSHILITKHQGNVPNTTHELHALPGVGLKTTNLVMGLAFDVPAICVDTHVHRISNLLGLVHTKTPEQTEAALKLVLPEDLWISWNRQLVLLGQHGCDKRARCNARCPLKMALERK